MKKKIAFIPVRKESKGIPEKNIKDFLGKPLICWIIDSVIEARIANEIWVATDCDCMENLIVQKYSSLVRVYRRSAESAGDLTPSVFVVLEFLKKQNYKDDDIFIMLQATSPFTSSDELKELNYWLNDSSFHSWIACSRLKKFRWREEGISLDYNLDNKPMRQCYDGFLVETGSYYASKVGNIKRSKQLLSGIIKLIELSSLSLIDIDEETDWIMAEECMKYMANKLNNEKKS